MSDSGPVVDITSSGGSLLPSRSSENDQWETQVKNHSVPRSDLNAVVMEYLVREGFREAAQQFQVETRIDPGLDQGVMDSQIKIRHAIETGDIGSAVETINDLDSEILDSNTDLFFHLQLQQLLEFIRQGDIPSALNYAQTELSARGEENAKFLNELEQALALFAYEDPKKSPFGNLLDNSQRLRVVSEVNSAILGTQGREGESRLSMLMKLVLWSQEQLEKKNVQFPKLENISEGKLTPPTQQSSSSSATTLQQQPQPMQQ